MIPTGNNDSPARRRRRADDLAPRPEIWAALDQGKTLKPILVSFYEKIFASDEFAHFFEGVTTEHVIGKQHSYLKSVFTGEKCYFGQRMRNAHHWMVISDELFDKREAIFEATLREFDLPGPIVDDWLSIHQIFRKQIIKSEPVPKKISGVSMPLEGYEDLKLECGSVCDGCAQATEEGTTIAFHVRTGKAYCQSCASDRRG